VTAKPPGSLGGSGKRRETELADGGLDRVRTIGKLALAAATPISYHFLVVHPDHGVSQVHACMHRQGGYHSGLKGLLVD